MRCSSWAACAIVGVLHKKAEMARAAGSEMALQALDVEADRTSEIRVVDGVRGVASSLGGARKRPVARVAHSQRDEVENASRRRQCEAVLQCGARGGRGESVLPCCAVSASARPRSVLTQLEGSHRGSWPASTPPTQFTIATFVGGSWPCAPFSW